MKPSEALANVGVLRARRLKLASCLAAAAVLALPARARAAGPVIVAYVAPPECASTDSFHALLASEIARAPNPSRPWRFSVTIRHDGDYVGTLETEGGSRELRAPTCDDVTAAIALVIATAEPILPAPPPPPPPVRYVPTPSAPMAIERDRATPAPPPAIAWRLGLRGQEWSDGSQLAPAGAELTASVEVPWGFPKMMFELGAGALFSKAVIPNNTLGNVAGAAQPWLIVDAQACPIDVPLGETGLSVLGCGRVVVGAVTSLAGWGGGGGRLRWQSPWRFYVESHFNGLYGTRVEGIPALMDFGGSVGFRI